MTKRGQWLWDDGKYHDQPHSEAFRAQCECHEFERHADPIDIVGGPGMWFPVLLLAIGIAALYVLIVLVVVKGW